MAPAPSLPPVPTAQRAASSVSSSTRIYATAVAVDAHASRGSNQQQLQQQTQQQLLVAQGASAAVSAAFAPSSAMAAPYVSSAGIIKPAADATAAADSSLLCNRSNSNSSLVLAPSYAASSRQGSANSSFFDADSVYETCCNSRASFLLPDDMEADAPFNSMNGFLACNSSQQQQQHQQLTPGHLAGHHAAAAGLSVPTAGAFSCMAADTAEAAVAAAGSHNSGIATASSWGLTPAAGAPARSPLVSASTVAALMEDDGTPSLDLLQLDGGLGEVGPGTSPFACQFMDDEASEQLLSLCGPAANPPGPTDVAGLFDTPDAAAAASAAVDLAAVGEASGSHGPAGNAPARRGMISLTASMAAAAALRRNQAGSSNSSPQHYHGQQHGQSQQNAPLMYRLVLLDGSTGTPMGGAAAARDAEKQSMLIGSSSPRNHAAADHAGAGTAAVKMHGSSIAAGAVPKAPRGRGRPKGSTNRRTSSSSSNAGVKAAAVAATAAAFAGSDECSDVAGSHMLHGHCAGQRAAAMEAAAAKAVAAAVAAASCGMADGSYRSDSWQVPVDVGSPAAAADSGSAGDSSNESAQTQQQDESAAKVAAAAGGKPGQRPFHHKGGGPCDHCGVLESPQWRRGPPAKPILCNACGTRYRRTHNLGPPIPSSGRPGGRTPGSGNSSHGGSSNGGRKRPAATAAALNTPVPVNMNGGVHTGTRSSSSPATGRRPVFKMARS